MTGLPSPVPGSSGRDLRGGALVHRRLLYRAADVDTVERGMGQWLMQGASDKAIALDGKILKGARRNDGTRVHLLSAFLHQQAITIGQLEVDGKTNEIPMVQPLLDPPRFHPAQPLPRIPLLPASLQARPRTNLLENRKNPVRNCVRHHLAYATTGRAGTDSRSQQRALDH